MIKSNLTSCSNQLFFYSLIDDFSAAHSSGSESEENFNFFPPLSLTLGDELIYGIRKFTQIYTHLASSLEKNVKFFSSNLQVSEREKFA